MPKLAISNVGPIKNGLGKDKFIEFDGLTILIGTQGSGKSTVAKVYSSLCWLEKSIVRGDLSKEEVENEGYFINDVMSFQGISDYFSEASYLHFIGSKVDFTLSELKFQVTINDSANYASPKIMYVPAERNFLTSIARPELISKLPQALHAFLAEYEEAKDYQRSNLVDLPIGSIQYQYEPEDGSSYLVGNDFRTNLLNGSSGYQSLVPLFLVTKYLCDFVSNKDKDKDKPYFSLSVGLHRRMMKELDMVVKKSKKPNNDLLKKLMDIQKRFNYSSFINIVEEPEQNLYPDAQKNILFELFKALNSAPQNRLVITTHSPYILNIINLNFQAHTLYSKKLPKHLESDLESIVPRGSSISPDNVKVYQLNGNGIISELEIEHGYIPDENKLNFKLEEINQQFSQLLYLGE